MLRGAWGVTAGVDQNVARTGLSATTLVERSSRGVAPTLQGKVLYERALNVERELAAATDAIHQMGGNMVGSLSVSAVPLAVLKLLPEAARTFGRDFPGVRLRIVEELFMAHLPRLRRREVDVAIGGVPDDLVSGEYSIEPLMTTRMVPVVRRGQSLAAATSLAELGGFGLDLHRCCKRHRIRDFTLRHASVASTPSRRVGHLYARSAGVAGQQ